MYSKKLSNRMFVRTWEWWCVVVSTSLASDISPVLLHCTVRLYYKCCCCNILSCMLQPSHPLTPTDHAVFDIENLGCQNVFLETFLGINLEPWCRWLILVMIGVTLDKRQHVSALTSSSKTSFSWFPFLKISYDMIFTRRERRLRSKSFNKMKPAQLLCWYRFSDCLSRQRL